MTSEAQAGRGVAGQGPAGDSVWAVSAAVRLRSTPLSGLGWLRHGKARPVFARQGEAWHGMDGYGDVGRGQARSGRDRAGHGAASHGSVGHGIAVLAPAGLCWARQGTDGGWMVYGAVRLRATHATRPGEAMPGVARPGLAWRGAAWLGAVRLGGAWLGAGEWHTPRFESGASTRGMVRRGDVGPGLAWRCAARQRCARRVEVGQGCSSGFRGASPRHPTNRGWAWPGGVWLGAAWPGSAMQGLARHGAVRPGMSWRGAARQGIQS